MKTIQQDVLEIDVYDENGKLVTNLNFTQKVELATEEKDGDIYLFVREATQDMNMLEIMGEKVIPEPLTDFEKNLFTKPEVNIIKFKANPRPVKLKLVGTGIDYNLETAEVEHDIKVIFPSVELVKNNNFAFGHGQAQTPVHAFKVLPYNEDGDLYEMQFKKRKQKP